MKNDPRFAYRNDHQVGLEWSAYGLDNPQRPIVNTPAEQARALSDGWTS